MKYFFLLSLSFSMLNAQQYPRWFLFQDEVPCKTKTVYVMRAPSLYKDTAIALAFRTGCDLLAKYTNLHLQGGQAFWTTEAGVHSMGASYTESYDSSLGDFYQSALKVTASFIDKQKTIVLIGDSSSCRVSETMNESVNVESIPQPKWVEENPGGTTYFYGVGTSEEYYYESSSWQRAEQNAVMSLARTKHSKVISIQKKTSIETQDLFNEDIDVELQNIEIVARWRDMKKKVFYVLARVLK